MVSYGKQMQAAGAGYFLPLLNSYESIQMIIYAGSIIRRKTRPKNSESSFILPS